MPKKNKKNYHKFKNLLFLVLIISIFSFLGLAIFLSLYQSPPKVFAVVRGPCGTANNQSFDSTYQGYGSLTQCPPGYYPSNTRFPGIVHHNDQTICDTRWDCLPIGTPLGETEAGDCVATGLYVPPCESAIPFSYCNVDSDCISNRCVNGMCRYMCTPSCTLDSQCSSGQCVNGYCLPSCTADSQCPAGGCVNGQCVPDCNSNSQCISGKCMAGLCSPPCTSNAQCPLDETSGDCVNGYCPRPCYADSQCPWGGCVNHYCSPRCNCNLNCPWAAECISGQCLPYCTTGPQCPSGECVNGQCVPSCPTGVNGQCPLPCTTSFQCPSRECINHYCPPSCTWNFQCPSGQCVNGYCPPSCTAADQCPSGQCVNGYCILLAVNGACGPANGVTVTSAPTDNLCSAGSASAVSGSGPWTWTCAGLNGGTTDYCSAPTTQKRCGCDESGDKVCDTTQSGYNCASATDCAYLTCPTQPKCGCDAWGNKICNTLQTGADCTNASTCASCTTQPKCGCDADGYKICDVLQTGANCTDAASCPSCPIQRRCGCLYGNPICDTNQFGANCTDAASCPSCLTSVNGVCGSAAKTYSVGSTAFTGTFCSAGTPNPTNPVFPTATPTTWVCNGLNGGTDSPTCTATLATGPVIGACGLAIGTYMQGESWSHGSYCAAGTPSPDPPSVLGTSAGSTSAWACWTVSYSEHCQAVRLSTSIGACGLAIGTYMQGESWPHGSYCAAGTPSPDPPSVLGTSAGSTSVWTCSGSSNCTATRAGPPTPGVCGSAAKTYPVGSTAFTGTSCSAGTPNTSPVFPVSGQNSGNYSVLGTYPVGAWAHSIATDVSGNIWVTAADDYLNDTTTVLLKIDQSGNVVERYHPTAYMAGASLGYKTIAIDASSGNIWVTNYSGGTGGCASLGGVIKLDSSGNLLGTYYIENPFTPPVPCHDPDIGEVAVDPSGNVWILNARIGSASLVKINPSGNILVNIPIADEFRTGNFAIDPSGNVWLGSWYSGNGHLLKLNSSGNISGLYDLGENTTVNAVAADRYGNVWVGLDEYTAKVNYIAKIDSSTGNVLGVYHTDITAYIYSIAADASGNIWASSGTGMGAALLNLDPLGNIIKGYYDFALAGFHQIAFDIYGNVWLTDISDKSVIKIGQTQLQCTNGSISSTWVCSGLYGGTNSSACTATVACPLGCNVSHQCVTGGTLGPCTVATQDIDCQTGVCVDSGLRVWNGSQAVHIAGEKPGTVTSALKIKENDGIWGLVLVDPTDKCSSGVKINTGSKIQSLAKCPCP